MLRLLFSGVADYYGRENLEAVETLKLLYQSLRALLKSAIPNRLVRAVFELKLMEINGEYMEKPLGRLEDSTIYTWEYVLASPVEKLYTFTVTEKVLEEFTKCVAENKRRFVDKTFHSLDIWMFLYINDVKFLKNSGHLCGLFELSRKIPEYPCDFTER